MRTSKNSDTLQCNEQAAQRVAKSWEGNTQNQSWDSKKNPLSDRLDNPIPRKKDRPPCYVTIAKTWGAPTTHDTEKNREWNDDRNPGWVESLLHTGNQQLTVEVQKLKESKTKWSWSNKCHYHSDSDRVAHNEVLGLVAQGTIVLIKLNFVTSSWIHLLPRLCIKLPFLKKKLFRIK